VETDRLTVKRWALLLFGAVLFCVYLTRVGWADVTAAGRVFPLGIALLVILLNSGTGILKLSRWQGLLRSRGISLPSSVGQKYLAVNAGLFLGLVTPGTAGELARGALSDVKNSRRFNGSVIALYIAKVYQEQKVRPLFIVQKTSPRRPRRT
jgi:hypothetical protein